MSNKQPKEGNRDHVIGAFTRMMDYLKGDRRVDNTTDPTSAYSMAARKDRSTPPEKTKQPDEWNQSSLPKKQKTFGVPKAK